MKKHLLLVILAFLSLGLQAQKDTASIAAKEGIHPGATEPVISIYPVPVRENYFTVKSDREIVGLKITNIIGQDIVRENYSNPLYIIKIILQNPKRGIYLVSISFADGTRIVRKIMIEGTA